MKVFGWPFRFAVKHVHFPRGLICVKFETVRTDAVLRLLSSSVPGLVPVPMEEKPCVRWSIPSWVLKTSRDKDFSPFFLHWQLVSARKKGFPDVQHEAPTLWSMAFAPLLCHLPLSRRVWSHHLCSWTSNSCIKFPLYLASVLKEARISVLSLGPRYTLGPEQGACIFQG